MSIGRIASAFAVTLRPFHHIDRPLPRPPRVDDVAGFFAGGFGAIPIVFPPCPSSLGRLRLLSLGLAGLTSGLKRALAVASSSPEDAPEAERTDGVFTPDLGLALLFEVFLAGVAFGSSSALAIAHN